MARATKEEQFLIKLLEIATSKEDLFEEVDSYIIGKSLGQKEHAVDMIVKQLAQANFIKKAEHPRIYITRHGITVAEQIKEAQK